MAGLLLARAEDDNTAPLFEDQRWSWRELLGEAATRSEVMVKVRPEGRPWHIGVLLENTPEYVFLISSGFDRTYSRPPLVLCGEVTMRFGE